MKDDLLIESITNSVIEIIAKTKNKATDNFVKVGVSGRHLHLSQEDLYILFGNGHELKKIKELMGGQFACEETVTLVGKNLSSIEKVRVLGPLRKETQVEISKTDSFKLGLKAPLRDSGDIKNSEPVTIVGPKGSLYLKEGCIIAKRHIHMSVKDASKFSVSDGEMVKAKILGERGCTLENILVRVNESYTLEMHIDTDEANGLDIKNGDKLEIIKP